MQIDKEKIIGQLFLQTVQLTGRVSELLETIHDQAEKIKSLEREREKWQNSEHSNSAQE